MRVLLIIVGIAFALALQVLPGAQASDGVRDARVYATVIDAETMPVHCDHFPCSDTTHAHAPCACAAFAHVSAQPLNLASIDYNSIRVAFMDDSMAGRTLLPPVPPPLV